MPSFSAVTIAHCAGTVTSDGNGNPVCSVPWQSLQTLAIDPASSSILTTLLDSGGVDWSTVEWIFGSGLILFATGAGVGVVVQIARRARHL